MGCWGDFLSPSFSAVNYEFCDLLLFFCFPERKCHYCRKQYAPHGSNTSIRFCSKDCAVRDAAAQSLPDRTRKPKKSTTPAPSLRSAPRGTSASTETHSQASTDDHGPASRRISRRRRRREDTDEDGSEADSVPTASSHSQSPRSSRHGGHSNGVKMIKIEVGSSKSSRRPSPEIPCTSPVPVASTSRDVLPALNRQRSASTRKKSQPDSLFDDLEEKKIERAANELMKKKPLLSWDVSCSVAARLIDWLIGVFSLDWNWLESSPLIDRSIKQSRLAGRMCSVD